MFDDSSKIITPPEWAPHKAIWTAWPSHADLWEDNLQGARTEVTAMIRVLAKGDTMKVLACGDEAIASAHHVVGDCAEIIPADFGDIWLRDTGPVFCFRDGQPAALRFANNGWGGKYELPGDESVGDAVALAAGVETIRYDFVLEGGAIELNGAGWLLSTKECLLNPNRNALEQDAVMQLLTQAFQCKRISLLEKGLLNDHTDGHIDNLVRFISRDVVVSQLPSGDDDPNRHVYDEIREQLAALPLTVQWVPSPSKVCNDDGDVMPASHMNFIIGNKAVVVPVYDEKYGSQVVEKFRSLFPGRSVIGLPSKHLLSGGGSFHCITQQQPAEPV